MKKWTAELFDDATEQVTVHGTSFRQGAFRKAIGPQVFRLETDPGNVHDHHAVKVILGEMHIGYLPKEISATYFPVVLAKTNRKVWTVARGEVGQFGDGDKWASLFLPPLASVKALAAPAGGK